jgi:mevalonate kinase
MKFKAKILLFGEYTVLHKSDALLVPFDKFSGELDFINGGVGSDNQKFESNSILKNFYNHFQAKEVKSDIDNFFNYSKLKEDIDTGLYFNSNIPMGYGIGSSGALIAAIYNRYYDPITFDISEIQQILAHFESFFHGSSSGLDPLVSLFNNGIYIFNNSPSIEEVNYSKFNPFLIDTGKSRATESFVAIFNNKCKSITYLRIVKDKLAVANNNTINSLRNGDENNFFSHLKELSTLQFNYMKDMILPEYEQLWQFGLESDNFYLKLCGAGGGGYILGFTKNTKIIELLSVDNKLNIIQI